MSYIKGIKSCAARGPVIDFYKAYKENKKIKAIKKEKLEKLNDKHFDLEVRVPSF